MCSQTFCALAERRQRTGQGSGGSSGSRRSAMVSDSGSGMGPPWAGAPRRFNR
jgi:hypothetical protein